MYLLITLFLIIYIFARCSGERLTKEENRKKNKDIFDSASVEWHIFWEGYSASDEDEMEVKKIVVDRRASAEEIRTRIKEEAGVRPTKDMIIKGLLAQRGKLLRYDAMFGFCSYPSGRRLDTDEQRKFLVWYDAELRSNGFGHKLMFSPEDDKLNVKMGDFSSSVWIGEHTDYRMGYYYWEPMRMFIGGHSIPIFSPYDY